MSRDQRKRKAPAEPFDPKKMFADLKLESPENSKCQQASYYINPAHPPQFQSAPLQWSAMMSRLHPYQPHH